jgi:hypothetical protein
VQRPCQIVSGVCRISEIRAEEVRLPRPGAGKNAIRRGVLTGIAIDLTAIAIRLAGIAVLRRRAGSAAVLPT